MYVFYNEDGTLKEVIADNTIRGSETNKIYVYWDKVNERVLDKNNWHIAFRRPDNTNTTYSGITASDYDNYYIEPNLNRDLKYFRYGVAYKMAVFELTDSIINQKGNYMFTVTAINVDDEIEKASITGLYVYDSVYPDEPDEIVSVAEYNTLLKLYGTGIRVYDNTPENLVEGEIYFNKNNGKFYKVENGMAVEISVGSVITIDNVLTEYSNNPVKSSGIYNAVELKENKTTEIDSYSTDNEYPSAKAVYNLFNTIKNFDIHLCTNASDTPLGVEWDKPDIVQPVHIVGTLVASEETIGKIYLVLYQNESGDFYKEYITYSQYSEGAGEYIYNWELIGSTVVNLDNYYTKTETNSLLGNKLDASKCTVQTTAPTSAITDGGIHIVYLTSEPATKYDGYIYFIKE